MSKKIDMKGQVFGKWTVDRRAPSKSGTSVWYCRCVCGAVSRVTRQNLIKGTSVGCMDCRERPRRKNRIQRYKKRSYIYINPTTKTVVDTEDVEMLARYSWYRDPKGYVFTLVDGKPVALHRMVMGEPEGKRVIHRDRNPMNNRKDNLKITTIGQAVCNSGMRKTNTSGKKGVSYHKGSGKWQAKITHKGVQHFLGTFDTIERAARVYDYMVTKLRGDYGVTNADIEGEK